LRARPSKLSIEGERVTTRVCVLGYPVGHSRSPAMHNAAYAELGLDWSYDAIEVPPADFDAVVRELPQRGYVGANVTVPHKLAALAVADSATDTARAVGAANTLSFTGGSIAAENTDVDGFLRALRQQMPGAPAGMRALVLGAGGAGRAVVYGLLREGAARVEVWNRNPERATALVEEFNGLAEGGGTLTAVADPQLDGVNLLVNATSVGMAVDERNEAHSDDFKLLRISADTLGEVQVVADLVYRDGGTALLREACARDLIRVEGVDILVQQGAASFELWTGLEAPLGVMRDGARKRQNAGDP
jgi:shikimate dehydrogenase